GEAMSDPHNLPPAPPDFYSRQYFLGRCGGYTEFVAGGGKVADPIRQTAFDLVAPHAGERILDLGCGRGELCWAIAAAGARRGRAAGSRCTPRPRVNAGRWATTSSA